MMAEERMDVIREIRKAKMDAINAIPEGISDAEWDRRYNEICERYDAQEIIKINEED